MADLDELTERCVTHQFMTQIAKEDFASSPSGCVRKFPCSRTAPMHLGSAHSLLPGPHRTNFREEKMAGNWTRLSPHSTFSFGTGFHVFQLPPRRHVPVLARGNLGGGTITSLPATSGALWTGHARQRGVCRSTSRLLYSIYRRKLRTRGQREPLFVDSPGEPGTTLGSTAQLRLETVQ